MINPLKLNMMKILAHLCIAILCLFTTTASAHIEKGPRTRMLTQTTHILNAYIASVAQGNVAQIGTLFTNDFKQNISGKDRIYSYNKDQIVKQLKNNKGIQQDCICSYQIIEQTKSSAIAKVSMKYDNFTKTDYLTLYQDGIQWKISQVNTTYH